MTAVIMLANLTVPFGNVLYVLLAFLGLLACSIIWEQLIFSYSVVGESIFRFANVVSTILATISPLNGPKKVI